jgi:RNA polymerase sigma factor (sigma-70 family)
MSAGDPTNVTEVLTANRAAFLAFLEPRVGSRALAEDILQEAFVRGLGRVEAVTEESIIAWFYRTLRNAAVDHHRRNQAAGRALAGFAAEIAAAEQSPSADPPLQAAVCQCVKRLAATLKPEYASALSRIEVDGVPVKDYAAEAGLSPGNAAVRIHRARAALRQQVSRSCGACAEHGCTDCTCS